MSKSVKLGLSLVGVLVIMTGCSSTSVNEGTQAETTPSPVTGTPSGDTTAVAQDNLIYFDFDRAELTSQARERLIQHASRLRSGNTDPVRLEGYTDDIGASEYNMALGERRARAVRDFLVRQGVDAGMLEVISYGQTRPAAQGSKASDRARNRRVEIRYND